MIPPWRLARANFVLMVVLMTAFAAWAPQNAVAQTGQGTPAATCAQLLSNVEQHLAGGCRSLDRDQVCYGNRTLKVEYTDSGTSTFAKEGDIAPLNTIKSITAGPLNPDQNEWGVAVLKVRASNLAGTSAGQVVTFILYGDTTLSKPTASAAAPNAPPATTCGGTITRFTYLRAKPGTYEQKVDQLPVNTVVTVTGRLADNSWFAAESQGKIGWLAAQTVKLDCDAASLAVDDPSAPWVMPGLSAFYFTTGVGSQASCTDIPPSGMLVQSPGGRKVTFKANGADITMGSTIILRATQNKSMTISVVEGQVTAVIGGSRQTFGAGQEATIPLTGVDGLEATGPISAPHALRGDLLSALFLSTLCKTGTAAGLNVPCVIAPPTPVPTPRPLSTPRPLLTPKPTLSSVCTQRTFRPDGTVCLPNYGIFPCNRDGICNNGESAYVCPEDCGNPLPPKGLGCPTTAPC